MFANRQLITAVGAVGLCLGIATQAAGASDADREPSNVRVDRGAAQVALLEAPSNRFDRSIAVHRYRVTYERAAELEVAPERSLLERGRASRPASIEELRAATQRLRELIAEATEPEPAPAPAPVAATPVETTVSYGGASAGLEAIAACESGGDPTAVSPDGSYRGKYQFDYGTWASVGGSGDPAAASESEQDMRAQMLYDQAGASPWPVCGS